MLYTAKLLPTLVAHSVSTHVPQRSNKNSPLFDSQLNRAANPLMRHYCRSLRSSRIISLRYIDMATSSRPRPTLKRHTFFEWRCRATTPTWIPRTPATRYINSPTGLSGFLASSVLYQVVRTHRVPSTPLYFFNFRYSRPIIVMYSLPYISKKLLCHTCISRNR